VYVADLDAIGGGTPQRDVVRQIAGVGLTLWLDAGISTVEQAGTTLEDGARLVVVGLETLPSFDHLAAVVRAVGGSRVVFSLDLRDGVPVVRAAVAHSGLTPPELARRAAAAGAGTLLVLDVHRVGRGGIDTALVERVRRAVPNVALYAGGGVRELADLTRLAAAGCDGALVASALHDGTVGRADVERLRGGRGRIAPRSGVSRDES